jgi:hypothetical protein
VRMANARPPSRRTIIGVHTASIAVCATALPAALPGIVIDLALIGSIVILALRRRRVVRP